MASVWPQQQPRHLPSSYRVTVSRRVHAPCLRLTRARAPVLPFPPVRCRRTVLSTMRNIPCHLTMINKIQGSITLKCISSFNINTSKKHPRIIIIYLKTIPITTTTRIVQNLQPKMQLLNQNLMMNYLLTRVHL